jgi:predicted dehydrogenase
MSTPAKKVRLGFVGVGGMGQCAHLKYYATTPGCEVAAIAEIRPQLAAKVARKYLIDKVYTSHEEMIKNENLDGLVAIQQFIHHGSLLPNLYSYNLPVITEKPLASSVEVGQDLLTKLSGTTSKHFVAYHKRSDLGTLEALKIIKQWQASGEFGKLRTVRASMAGGDWIANGFFDLLTTAEKPTGLSPDPKAAHTTDAWHAKYVTMVNFYIHQINLIRMLVGNDYKVTFGDKTGRLMVGHTPDDALVTLEMNFFSPTAWSESFLVTFDKAWLRLDFPAPVSVNQSAQLTVYRSASNGQLATTSQVGIPWQSAMANQAAQYIQAIQGQATTLETAQEAMKDLIVARDLVNAIEAAKA